MARLSSSRFFVREIVLSMDSLEEILKVGESSGNLPECERCAYRENGTPGCQEGLSGPDLSVGRRKAARAGQSGPAIQGAVLIALPHPLRIAGPSRPEYLEQDQTIASLWLSLQVGRRWRGG
jgi:hypothetical protein